MTTHIQLKLEAVAIGDLRSSKTNPRKHFNEGSLQELADSIAAQGIRQPILARPKAAETPLEIVAGERRYRAAKLARLDVVPCVISEMSDNEAIEVQVVENLQRSDLTEMEEAESYQAMLDLRGDGGAACYTVPLLSKRFGISESKIYQRLKLLAVPEEGRKALEAGTVGARQLVLIGRIPDPAAREAALEKVLRPQYSSEPLTYKETEKLISEQFMQGLKGAPFKLDDAKLLPAAGACSGCPKMTDNCRHLFTPEEAAQFAKRKVCTDPGCFRNKIEAVWLARTERASKEGQQVLSERESREIFPTWQSAGEMSWESPYVFPGDKPDRGLLKPEVADTVGTWRSLIDAAEQTVGAQALAAERAKITQDDTLTSRQKKEALAQLAKLPPKAPSVPPVLARDQAGVARELVDRKLAIAVIEEAGEPIFLGKIGGRSGSGGDDFAKQRKKELEAAKLRLAESLEGMERMHAALVSKWQPSPVWESLFEIAMRHAGADGLWLFGKWKGLKFGQHNTEKEEVVAKFAMELPANERQALVPLLLIGQQMKWSGLGEGFVQISQGAELGLDVKEISDAVKARMKGEKKAKETKAAKKTKVGEKAEADGAPVTPSATDPKILEQWVKAAAGGMPIAEIARSYGTTEADVAGALEQPPAEPVAKSKRHVRITPELKLDVQTLHNEGRTLAEIAKRVGISVPSVQNIKKELGLVKPRLPSPPAVVETESTAPPANPVALAYEFGAGDEVEWDAAPGLPVNRGVIVAIDEYQKKTGIKWEPFWIGRARAVHCPKAERTDMVYCVIKAESLRLVAKAKEAA